jgi:hypothetical protein
MHLEILVEEQSMEAALNNILPKLLPGMITFRVYPYNGKSDLLAKLPSRLRGYRAWLPQDYRLIVLLDLDTGDCRVLKKKLEMMALEAGFHSKGRPDSDGKYAILNRIAIEELEAWFFGDIEAIVKAFPGVPSSIVGRRPYRNPDAIKGGTWEALERILKKAGYYGGGMPAVETARKISEHMNPNINRSQSFRVFRDGIHHMVRSNT